MLAFDATTKSLEIKLGGAVTTTELPFVTSYVDINQTTFAATASSEQDGTTNGTTAVVIVTAPGATTTRKLNFLSVVNVDTAAVTLTVQYNNNTTLRIAFKIILAVGDQLSFTDAGGWVVFDSNGNRKSISTIGVNAVTLAMMAQVATASVLGRNTAGTGNVEVLTTLPTAVQDNITRLGTIVSGVWNAGAVTSSGVISAATSVNSDVHKGRTAVNTVFKFSEDTVFMTANYATGGVAIAGPLTVNGLGGHVFSAGGSGLNTIALRNTTAGAGNGSLIRLGNDAVSNLLDIFALSSTYTSSGPYLASGVVFNNGGVGGLSIIAEHASGTIRFYTGGTTLRAQININGTQTWAPYGAGAATFDASGNITSVSDLRYKNRISPLLYGLKEVLKLNPIQHGYNKRSGLERKHLYGGFIAQEVKKAGIHLAVGKNPQGYLTLSDRVILGAVVNAIKELNERIN